jgi:hypothetical protein
MVLYDFLPDWDAGFGQAAFYEYVLGQAQKYIDNSSLMHYGEDDRVSRPLFSL